MNFLKTLTLLYPAQTVLHIGEGRRNISNFIETISPEYILTTVGNCAMVEKSGLQFQWPTNYQSVETIIDAESEQAYFYQTSLSSESGLISPDNLKQIWQNLTTVKKTPVKTESLTDFLNRNELAETASTINWLSIDCLSSANILHGSQENIRQCDIIIARTVITQDFLENTINMTVSTIEKTLIPQGFQLVSVYPESNSTIGQAIFIKNYKSISGEMLSQRESLESELAEVKADKDKQDQETTNLNNQIDTLTKEKLSIASELKRMETERSTILEEKEALKEEKEALKKEKEALKREAQSQISLNSAQGKAIAEYKVITTDLKKKQKNNDENMSTIKQLRAEIKQLEQKLVMSEHNIKDLREQYKLTTRKLSDQTEAMSNVLTILKELPTSG